MSESLVIGDEIEVVVVEIQGGKVRLGIKAPKNVPVHRKEVWDAIQGQPIQVGPEDVSDLGQRVIDPLGVAPAYEQE